MNTGRREDVFDKFVSPTKVNAAQDGIPYIGDISITTYCPGTCKFCFTGSDSQGKHIPTEKLKELIDQFKALKFRQLVWEGGESLLHPGIFEIVRYAAEKEIGSAIWSAGLPLAKKETAQKVYQLYQRKEINVFGIHIDTRDRRIFDQLHANPKELDKRLQGLNNLLDTGFPADRLMPCITLTRQAAETIEETIDWYVDEIGVRFLELVPFKPMGFGQVNLGFEPSLSDVRRAYEYRARKLGSDNWARIGSTECTTLHCRTTVFLEVEGSVMACAFLPREMAAGNFYRESLVDILEKHWRKLTFRDLKVKGKCAECDNNDICEGCRTAAYYYLGDIEESDPKCWHNPAARDGTYLTNA